MNCIGNTSKSIIMNGITFFEPPLTGGVEICIQYPAMHTVGP